MPLEQEIEADCDLASILGQFTNYIQNERVRAYNEGVDAERERCAKIAEDHAWTNKSTSMLGPEQNSLAIARKIKEAM